MKKHNTFAGEQAEITVPDQKPEVSKPADPGETAIPQENPENIPDELPSNNQPPEDPPLNPGSLS